MKRKFNIGDKVKLNPNMDYIRIGFRDNIVSSEAYCIRGYYQWKGDQSNSKGEFFRDLNCYSLYNQYSMPEAYLLRIK